MEKSQILKAFNDHFVDFIDDVKCVFPNDQDILTARNAIVSFRKMNPKMVLMCFKESVIDPYRKEIEAGDIEFFATKNYEMDVQKSDTPNQVLDTIDKFRQPVKEMSEENQEKAIKYMQNLVKLSDMYFS